MQMSHKLKLRHTGLILVFVPVLFEVLFVGVLIALLIQTENQINTERKIKDVIAQSEELTQDMYTAGWDTIHWRLSRNESYIADYQQQMESIPSRLEWIKTRADELLPNDHSFDKAEHLARIGLHAIRELKAQADLRYSMIMNATLDAKMHNYLNEMRHFVTRMKELEHDLPEKAAINRRNIIICVVAWLIASIALAVALAEFFYIGTAKRLSVLMENTYAIVARKPLHRRIGGSDEIAHLDTVFHQMAFDLDETAKRKQELVSMVSHDLRTPLMSIQASLELLTEGKMGELPPPIREELNVADYSAQRLIELINDLLDIDKIEAGKFELHRRQFDVGWIFERCYRSVKYFADRHKVQIVVPDDSDEMPAFGDPDRLAQVITNLVSNAVKFSKPGTKVELQYKDLPNKTLFKVIDQGRGIPRGKEHHIFERFQQVEAADATQKKGSGLGLAICKMLIDAHDGTIGVDSEEGVGSTFWFTIPKKPAEIGAQRSTVTQ